ncbi:DUF4132 domain-containing protein [Brachybacterium sp. GCM10030267]|uniref:DUF4132 domain-containing protein n=1 Tax=Brachybacterium sp. GCM10030267 TaxID=3273381 RepID=UPI00360F31B3
MANWFGRLRGKQPSVPAWHQAIRELVAEHPQRADVEAYLLTGQWRFSSPLRHGRGGLHLLEHAEGRVEAGRAVTAHLGQMPDQVALRLAEVLSAERPVLDSKWGPYPDRSLDGLEWLDGLLSLHGRSDHHPRREASRNPPDHVTIERLLTADGRPASTLVEQILQPGPRSRHRAWTALDWPGIDDAVARHREAALAADGRKRTVPRRGETLQALGRLSDETLARFRGHLESEAAADESSLRFAAGALLARLDPAHRLPPPTDLPRLPEVTWTAPLDPQVREQILAIADRHGIPHEDLEIAFFRLELGTPPDPHGEPPKPRGRRAFVAELGELDLDPAALMSVLDAVGCLLFSDGEIVSGTGIRALRRLAERTGHPTATEFAALAEDAGIDARAIAGAIVDHQGDAAREGLGHDAPAGERGDLAVRYLDALLEIAETAAAGLSRDVLAFLHVLAEHDRLPEAAEQRARALALDGAPTHRDAARRLLAALPDAAARAAAALDDPVPGRRAAAAQWVVTVATSTGTAQDAVATLQRALATETDEETRGTLVECLADLGSPPTRNLDKSAVIAAAQKAAARKPPAALAWFPVDDLPDLTWADDGGPIDASLARHLVLEAHRGTSPQPGAHLRAHVALIAPADRAALGGFVLEHWLSEDLGAERGSGAAKSPGLLALVAACGAGHSYPRLVDYIENHTRGSSAGAGGRAAQRQALFDMLAATGDDDVAAIRALLTIHGGVGVEATTDGAFRAVLRAAEHRGLDIGVLEDLAMPDFGFDDAGQQTLSYGARTFTAVLEPDLTVTLRDADGTTLPRPPKSAATDDKELAAQARRRYARWEEAFEGVSGRRTARLADAAGRGEAWSPPEWRERFLDGPVRARIAHRVLWRHGEVIFRPTLEGDLAGVDGDPVDVPVGGVVSIVATDELHGAERRAWADHFRRSGLTPWEHFDQVSAEAEPAR